MKQLERDLDRSKHGAAQVIQRNEQLVKEMEQQKHHGGFAQMQVDGLKRELQDALVSTSPTSLCSDNLAQAALGVGVGGCGRGGGVSNYER